MAGSNYASRSWTRRSKQQAASSDAHTNCQCRTRSHLFAAAAIGQTKLRKVGGRREGARVVVGTGQRVAEERQMPCKVTCCSPPTSKKADEMNIELFADRWDEATDYSSTSPPLYHPSAQKEKCHCLCMLPSRRATKCKSNVMDDLSGWVSVQGVTGGGPWGSDSKKWKCKMQIDCRSYEVTSITGAKILGVISIIKFRFICTLSVDNERRINISA